VTVLPLKNAAPPCARAGGAARLAAARTAIARVPLARFAFAEAAIVGTTATRHHRDIDDITTSLAGACHDRC
jgi:hypothetical protein